MKSPITRPGRLLSAYLLAMRPAPELVLLPKEDHWSSRPADGDLEVRSKGWTEKSRSGRR